MSPKKRVGPPSWLPLLAIFGKLDVLVNNAGISGSAEQDFYSTEAWHRIMAVNATGVFFGIKHAISAMIANGGSDFWSDHPQANRLGSLLTIGDVNSDALGLC